MSTIPEYNFPNLVILSLLGRGGMASVWKARQVSLDRLVAVKVLSPSFTTDHLDIQRFNEEARTAAQLKHPGIVQVYDANFANGFYYFMMELVDGYTFGYLLRRKGRISEDDALTIAESVALALDYAWTTYQMVHCDIKPDNIMVDADGTVKVTDLGLSRSALATHEGDEDNDDIYGTPAYMSPEQVYGVKSLDCRADIYGLGATLYHLTAGRMLFYGKSDDDMIRCHVDSSQAADPRRFTPNLSRSWVSLLERMLGKEPENRYRDWKHVLKDLAHIRSGRAPVMAYMPPNGSSLLVDRSD